MNRESAAAMFVRELGTGEPVVLLHGGGTNSGQVASFPIGGGSGATILAMNQAEPMNVGTDGAYVYWADQAWQQSFPATINRMPVGGGTTETLVSEPPNEHSTVFALDGANLYYMVQLAGAAAAEMWSVPKIGGTSRAIATLPADCTGSSFVVNAASLFYTDTCSPGVYRVQLP